MSDDDNVQYIKKPRKELEEAATNDESNKKGENSAANPPQVHISTETKALIDSLREVQQRREEKQIMRVSNVKTVAFGREFYGTIEISSDAILIIPDDLNMINLYLMPCNIKEFYEEGLRGIMLNLYCDPQKVMIFFRKERQVAQAMKRLEQLKGSESISESSSSGETSVCALTPN